MLIKRLNVLCGLKTPKYYFIAPAFWLEKSKLFNFFQLKKKATSTNLELFETSESHMGFACFFLFFSA